MSGLDLARPLQYVSWPITVILMTEPDERAVDAYDAGAVDVLRKPLRLERFTHSMQRIAETN